MPRVKRGTQAHKKREKILKQAKGFRWGRKSKERLAKEALLHAWSNAFRGRKEKKREYRRLWNVQINAAVREHGMKYSEFINALKKKNITLNRKVLSQIAREEPKTLEKIVEEVKK
ncbi:50S ribosomal protein L20 [bacterium]|nr:50S ribosomal protein L20 [bacterium]|tara:strand:+ start:687 stop:1034 length:348 start_codon:yes stop_codon:yes gene_type:complete